MRPQIVVLLTAAVASGQPGRMGGPGRFSPIFAALDSDSDRKISAAEIAGAQAALKALDKDGDGTVSFEELRPRMRGPEGRGGPGAPGSPNMVAMLMDLDANKDGKLTRDELPERMQRLLARADADKDRALTRDELEKLAASHAENRENGRGALEGFRRGSGPGGFTPDPLRAAIDTDHNGKFSAAELAASATALKALDKDGDGAIALEEVRPLRRAEARPRP